MKKLLCFGSLLFLCLLMTGCGGNNQLVCTKTNTEDGITTEEKVTVDFKSNRPSTMLMEMNLKLSGEQKNYIDLMYTTLDSTFSEMETEGVDIDTSKKDDSISVKLNIDFSKVKDSDKLDLEVSEDDTYEATREQLIEEGYQCK